MKKVTVLTSLYRCAKYLNGYFDCVNNLENKSDVEILLLHNDPSKEELEIIEKRSKVFSCIRHIIISEREGLYKTWNRGIKLSQSEYVCVWNVDDIRFSDSIKHQISTLDLHPDALLTYGDFYYMFQYPEISDKIYLNKDYEIEPESFFKSHQIGCFPMWRKSLHDSLGYFDEQLDLVADFDFQIRLARSGNIIKTSQILGGYLEFVPEKLSSNYVKQKTEQNLLYLRYGIFDRCNYFVLFSVLRKYRVKTVRNFDKEFLVSFLFPSYQKYRISKLPLILLSLYYQPRCFLSYVKHNILGK